MTRFSQACNVFLRNWTGRDYPRSYNWYRSQKMMLMSCWTRCSIFQTLSRLSCWISSIPLLRVTRSLSRRCLHRLFRVENWCLMIGVGITWRNQIRRSERMPVPRSVQEAVQQRTAYLTNEAKWLLSLAAVAGRRFDFAILQQVMHCDEEQLLLLMKELVSGDEFVSVMLANSSPFGKAGRWLTGLCWRRNRSELLQQT